MTNKKLSLTYLLLRKCGLNFSEEEYGQINFISALKKGMKTWINGLILKYCAYSAFFGNLNYRLIRPRLYRLMGVTVGKDVFIGYDVWVDIGNANLITIEDRVHIANKCIILCHQRDLDEYRVGSDYSKFPYHKKHVVLKKGCLLGMGSMIMPGVTIGEGALIGAGSIVFNDIPDWTVAIGRPAKVVRRIKE